MAALAFQNGQPMITLPDGTLIPVNPGALVQTPPPRVAAAQTGRNGVPAAAMPDSNVVAMNTRRGTHPGPALMHMRTPDFPQQGGPDLGALVSAITKNSGASALPVAAPTPAGPAAATPEPGLLDRLKGFFLGGATSGQPPTTTTPPIAASGALPQQPAAAAPEGTGDDFFTRLQKNPMALALMMGGLTTMGNSAAPGSLGSSLATGALTGINSVYDQRAQAEADRIAAQKAAVEGALKIAQADQAHANALAIPQKAAAYADYQRAHRGEAEANAAAIPIRAAAAAQTAARQHFGQPIPGEGTDPKTGKTVPGIYVGNLNTGEVKFTPGITLTGKPGSKTETALQKNAKFYVDNGIAPDMKSAVNMLRSGVNDATQYQRLVQAEKKIILNTPAGMSMTDAEAEAQAEKNVQARTASAASRARATQAPAPRTTTGALDPSAAAHPQSAADLEKLPSGALYINPSDNKLYRKK